MNSTESTCKWWYITDIVMNNIRYLLNIVIMDLLKTWVNSMVCISGQRGKKYCFALHLITFKKPGNWNCSRKPTCYCTELAFPALLLSQWAEDSCLCLCNGFALQMCAEGPVWTLSTSPMGHTARSSTRLQLVLSQPPTFYIHALVTTLPTHTHTYTNTHVQ